MRNVFPHVLLSCLLLLAASVGYGQPKAQDRGTMGAREDEVTALKAEMERMRAEIAAFRDELQRLRAEAAKAAKKEAAQ